LPIVYPFKKPNGFSKPYTDFCFGSPEIVDEGPSYLNFSTRKPTAANFSLS
jgi:hypothetical protein